MGAQRVGPIGWFMRTAAIATVALAVTGMIEAHAGVAPGTVVLGCSPNEGILRALVTIQGSGFTGATAVKFGGTPAQVIQISDTQITTRVPDTAATGWISVTGPGGTSTCPDPFAVTPGLLLSDTVRAPKQGVRVAGSGFAPGESVQLSLDATRLKRLAAGATGAFSTSTSVPSTATPGVHMMTATGETSGRTAYQALLVRSNWSMFRADPAHTGQVIENVLKPATVGGLHSAWTYDTPSGVNWSSPAVVNGIVYVGGSDGILYAFNAVDGVLRWTYNAGAPIYSSPAVLNDEVYFASGDGVLHAVNARFGTPAWATAPLGNNDLSSPTVAPYLRGSGVVFVGGTNTLYAFSATNGGQVWATPIGGTHVDSAPAYANRMVYVGSYDHHLYALNAGSGALDWAFTTADVIDSSPSVVGGVLYIGSRDGTLHALDPATGAQKWAAYVGAMSMSSPAVGAGADKVFIGNNAGQVKALDASTGALKWTFNTGTSVVSSPAVAAGVVYIASGPKIFALNASNGSKLWSFAASGFSFTSSPTVNDGALYIGAQGTGGKIYQFRTTS